MTSMKHDQSGTIYDSIMRLIIATINFVFITAGVNQVVKGCELRDNPLGENRDLCKVNQQPGNMGYTCACKTSDNCNSKDNSERLVQSALQSGPSNAAAGGTGGSAQQGFLGKFSGSESISSMSSLIRFKLDKINSEPLRIHNTQ